MIEQNKKKLNLICKTNTKIKTSILNKIYTYFLKRHQILPTKTFVLSLMRRLCLFVVQTVVFCVLMWLPTAVRSAFLGRLNRLFFNILYGFGKNMDLIYSAGTTPVSSRKGKNASNVERWGRSKPAKFLPLPDELIFLKETLHLPNMWFYLR